MTTLRIEVGRRSGTTIADVVAGLDRAGCMKSLEIDPDQIAFLPIDDLRDALVRDGFFVELVPWPPPPPLPLWARVRAWPYRVWMWGRRVVLRETEEEQFARVYWESFVGNDALHRASTRESPMMKAIRDRDRSP